MAPTMISGGKAAQVEYLLEQAHKGGNFRDQQAGARGKDQIAQGGLHGAGKHIGELFTLGDQTDQRNDCKDNGWRLQ